MRTIAFVGPSGTGKSHRSMIVAKKYGADCVIDDGLLICGSKVLAGTSAKKEATRVASVKHALFLRDDLANEMKKAVAFYHPDCIMILGTSDGMVKKIAARLNFPAIEQFIQIGDVATEEEIQLAHDMRMKQGKHVIPVPTFEIKQDFSGYFLHPLRIFQKKLDEKEEAVAVDKSIIRPTFSYMGDYEISDNVVLSIAGFEAQKVAQVFKINGINLRKTEHGAHIDMTVTLLYGCDIQQVCYEIQQAVGKYVELYTSVNARRVHIYVKALKVPESAEKK